MRDNPYYEPLELEHYGIKGMKWGVRKDRQDKANKELEQYKKKQRRKVMKVYRKQADKANKIAKKQLVDDWHDQRNNRAMRLGSLYAQEFDDIRNITYNQMKQEKLNKLSSKTTRRGERWVDQYFEKTGIASEPYWTWDDYAKETKKIYPLVKRAIQIGSTNGLSENELKLIEDHKKYFQNPYR